MTAAQAKSIRREATRISRVEAVLDAIATTDLMKANGVKARDVAPFFGCCPQWSRIMTHMEIRLLEAA